MPLYRYSGTNSRGEPVRGEREAPNPDALLAALADDVLLIDSVREVAPEPAPARLSGSEAEAVSGHLAELMSSDLPLESGLAAIADESPSPRLRETLLGIARELERGADLETALAARNAPAELQALVRASARSGNTGQVLVHYSVNAQAARDVRQSILQALLYPGVLLLLFAAISGFLFWSIVPQFVAVFEGFDLDVPWLTVALIDIAAFFREHGAVALGVGAAVVVAIVMAFRGALGPVGFRRLVCCIPILGPVLRWQALGRFSRLLSLLVENRVPLDEALRLAADASHDAEVQDDCRRILKGVQAGDTLESAARKLGRIPPSFVRALCWEREAAGLPEVLQSLGDVYAGRVRALLALVVALLPPILVVALGGVTLIVVIAIFYPLFSLLGKLS